MYDGTATNNGGGGTNKLTLSNSGDSFFNGGNVELEQIIQILKYMYMEQILLVVLQQLK